ncbi:hypothetical protein, partial [Mesorhizobium sp. M0134]|uniref:hypothetical protein n=1 Tax=unclassified Mesorhizobium TaxID=325217 RepID=UPI0033377932
PLRRTSCNKQKRTSDVLQKPDNLKSYRHFFDFPHSRRRAAAARASTSDGESRAIARRKNQSAGNHFGAGAFFRCRKPFLKERS